MTGGFFYRCAAAGLAIAVPPTATLSAGVALVAPVSAAAASPPRDVFEGPASTDIRAEYQAMKAAFAKEFTPESFSRSETGEGVFVFGTVCDYTLPYEYAYAPISGRELMYMAHVFATYEGAIGTLDSDQISSPLAAVRQAEERVLSRFMSDFESILASDPEFLRRGIRYDGEHTRSEHGEAASALLSPIEQLWFEELQKLDETVARSLEGSGIKGIRLGLECGGTGFASFQLTSAAPIETVHLLGKWGAMVCEARALDPWGPRCRGWRAVAPPSEEIVGSYYYRAVIKDGPPLRGEISFEGRGRGSFEVHISPAGVSYRNSN